MNKFFDKYFVYIGILLQLVVFILTNGTWLSLISGIAGIISVVLCSQRKLSFYIWGFIQLFTYVILAWQQCFYGELIENLFYFVTMLIGIFIWKDKYNNIVETRSLTRKQYNNLAFGTFGGICILGLILELTNDTQPWLDAASTVPAFVAQILLILRYKENWLYWLIIDLVSIVMWIAAGNWIMATQFIFWSINCIYGYYKWKN